MGEGSGNTLLTTPGGKIFPPATTPATRTPSVLPYISLDPHDPPGVPPVRLLNYFAGFYLESRRSLHVRHIQSLVQGSYQYLVLETRGPSRARLLANYLLRKLYGRPACWPVPFRRFIAPSEASSLLLFFFHPLSCCVAVTG